MPFLSHLGASKAPKAWSSQRAEVDLLFEQGVELYRTGRLEAALDAGQQAYCKLAQYPEALTCYQQALAIYPKINDKLRHIRG
jgi:tetratricopeptide (TPR) repeat protein